MTTRYRRQALPYPKPILVSEVKANNRAAGRYFFEPDTLRYFRSRIGETLYTGKGGAFFVTSEKRDGQPRWYTVRQAIRGGADIVTAANFQEFGSAKTAAKYAAGYADKSIPVPLPKWKRDMEAAKAV